MFENLMSMEEKQSPIDALLRLLDTDKRDSSTIVEMPNIKFLTRSRWLFLKKKYPHLSIIERQELLMEYYKNLKPSYEGMSWNKIVEGIKEMKPQLLDANIQEGMMQR